MNKTDKIRAIRDDPAASPGEKKAAEEMLRRISGAEKITNKISIKVNHICLSDEEFRKFRQKVHPRTYRGSTSMGTPSTDRESGTCPASSGKTFWDSTFAKWQEAGLIGILTETRLRTERPSEPPTKSHADADTKHASIPYIGLILEDMEKIRRFAFRATDAALTCSIRWTTFATVYVCRTLAEGLRTVAERVQDWREARGYDSPGQFAASLEDWQIANLALALEPRMGRSPDRMSVGDVFACYPTLSKRQAYKVLDEYRSMRQVLGQSRRSAGRKKTTT